MGLADKRNAFTEEHSRLLTSLPQPFTIALAMRLLARAELDHRAGDHSAPKEPLRFESLGSEGRSRPDVEPMAENESLPDLDTVVARHIRKALDAAGGKIHGLDGAGALLGVNPNTPRAKMRKLGIPFGRSANAGN